MSAGLQLTRRSLFQSLFQAFAAVLSALPFTRCTFIHNAKLYDLHTRFSEAAGVVTPIGRIVEHGSSNDSEFRVWFDSSDPTGLPTKIEFRPKSSLHLTFHQDPSAGGLSVRRLVVPEEAQTAIRSREEP